eukprot:gene24859-10519_t
MSEQDARRTLFSEHATQGGRNPQGSPAPLMPRPDAVPSPACFGCAWCKGSDDHAGRLARKECQEFWNLKQNAFCSKSSYLKEDLGHAEQQGFAAAGVLMFRRIGDKRNALRNDVELLLVREFRLPEDAHPKDVCKLDWVSGRRNNKAAVAAEVAIRKCNAQTRGKLSLAVQSKMCQPGGFPLVYWSPESKSALFLLELTSEADREVDKKVAEDTTLKMSRKGGDPGAKRLE